MTDLAPKLANRYRLTAVLGTGGMATVYRAWDERLEVERAVKILASELASKPVIRRRFENEARTMAKLHHPNIVTVHDVDEDGDRVYLVMELVTGGSLIDALEREGALLPRRAIDLMLPVLLALQTAHERGVVHRDIKPHNILLTEHGVPKVSDFGIAHVDSDARSLTKTNAVMGTLAYMAPEQRTNAKAVDARADVYALGATLYALMTRREPFDLYATEVAEDLLVGVPDALASVVRRATRYRPEHRFPSARAFHDALLAVRDRIPEGHVAISYRAAPTSTGPGVTWADGGLSVVEPAVVPATGFDEAPSLSTEARSLGSEASTTFPEKEPEAPIAPNPLPPAWLLALPLVALLAIGGWWLGPAPAPENAGSAAPSAPTEASSAPAEGSSAPAEASSPRAEEPSAPAEASSPPDPSRRPSGTALAASPPPAPVRVEKTGREGSVSTAPSPPTPSPPEPTPEPSVVAPPSPPGELFVNARPPGQVRIDGGAPLKLGFLGYKAQLAPGPHTIELIAPDGAVKQQRIELTSGGKAGFCWDFTRGGECS